MPIGVIKRILKTRDVLDLAFQSQNPRRGKKLVLRAVRMLQKAGRIRAGAVRTGKASPECASSLGDLLSSARTQCQSWLDSFSR